MNFKNVLVVAHHPLLLRAHQEKLAHAGFSVTAATDADSAVAAIEEKIPDLIVLDLVLPDSGGIELIQRIRGTAEVETLPIIALPTQLGALVRAAADAGVTAQLPREGLVTVNLIETARKLLDIDPPKKAESPPTQQKHALFDSIFRQASKSLESISHSLHRLIREAGSREACEMLWQEVHDYAEQMRLIDQRAIFHLASALEALVFDVCRQPQQLNASITRTLGQAVDLLNALLDGDATQRIKDPASAQILIVEDETNARELLMAAMQLVRIESIGVDSPSTCLQTLLWDHPDLILLDIGLPEMDGFELCEKIRNTPPHEQTPIVFITGLATFQNRVQSRLRGGHDFIAKPFHLSELGVKALTWIYKGQLQPT